MMTKTASLILSAVLLSQVACAKTPINTSKLQTQSQNTSQPVYQLTSHVLDINSGIPAANVKIALHKQQANGTWQHLDTKYTNDNGRIRDFLPKTEGNESANDGIYKLVFHTADYYGNLNVPTFYPYVEVSFIIKGGKHYHVPITLSPFGYSTYRGS